MKSPDIRNLADPALIKDLEAQTKSEALLELIDLIAQSPKILDKAAFTKAILEREKLVSTGIGLSVAVPHAKISSVADYVVAIGRSRTGIEFDSLDSQPVKIVFLLGSSDRQVADFVKLLAQIVNLIKNGANRVALLEAKTPEEICKVIQEV